MNILIEFKYLIGITVLKDSYVGARYNIVYVPWLQNIVMLSYAVRKKLTKIMSYFWLALNFQY